MLKFKMNKKGQVVGETVTWVVASVLIVLILAAALVVVATYHVVSSGGKTITLQSNTDLLAEKSLAAYLLTKNPSGDPIYAALSTSGNFNGFNGPIARNIFSKLYNGTYYVFSSQISGVYLGISNSPTSIRSNNYFKTPTLLGMGGGSVSYSLNIVGNKFANLGLVK